MITRNRLIYLIVAIVAMEKTALLLAVDGVVGGIEVEDKLFRNSVSMTLFLTRNEGVDEGSIDGPCGRRGLLLLESAEGCSAGHLCICVGRGLVQGIIPESVCIVKVFIAGSDSHDSLPHHSRSFVDQLTGLSFIHDTAFDTGKDPDALLSRAQEHKSCI